MNIFIPPDKPTVNFPVTINTLAFLDMSELRHLAS
ncbi:MAG: hypothetical protein ACI934_001690 [Pseudohongiellaceae bacterium]|jgi:hypothetical protein